MTDIAVVLDTSALLGYVNGHAAYAAIDHRAHLATMRPHVFAALLPEDWSILDLR